MLLYCKMKLKTRVISRAIPNGKKGSTKMDRGNAEGTGDSERGGEAGCGPLLPKAQRI
jgi:hypothetical protein